MDGGLNRVWEERIRGNIEGELEEQEERSLLVDYGGARVCLK